MANKAQNQDTASDIAEKEAEDLLPALETVETICEKLKVSKAVFAGLCAANKWRPGKAITKEAFVSAMNKFTEAPADGRCDKENKKSEAKK